MPSDGRCAAGLSVPGGRAGLLAASLLAAAGCSTPAPAPGREALTQASGVTAPHAAVAPAVLSQPWESIQAAARGQTVTMAMWDGDPFINAYMREWVAPRLLEKSGVALRIVGAQGNQIVSMLMSEMEAGRPVSDLDVLWINGETFFQLRRLGALFGPFTQVLPNARMIDFDNPFIGRDFQQPVDGFECPWGNVQFALIYDQRRVGDPPRTREAIAQWAHAHPGRFTWDAGFTGMTFLKSLLIDMAGRGELDGEFDEAKYARFSSRLWDWVRDVRPDLWKRGETFPAGTAQLHQLFAGGETDFTMSNNDGEVDNKVLQGLFPESARAFVLDSGTIQNSHFLGIERRSAHIEAALVLVDLLVSPEAQYEKLQPAVWGDGTVLDTGRLPAEWRLRFDDVPRRRFAPKRSEIQSRALQELAPEYMIRLAEDFRKQIIER